MSTKEYSQLGGAKRTEAPTTAQRLVKAVYILVLAGLVAWSQRDELLRKVSFWRSSDRSDVKMGVGSKEWRWSEVCTGTVTRAASVLTLVAGCPVK